MIKPVDEIPESRMSAAKSYRQRITDDIQEAIDKGIPLFEFVGDYNFKYLAQYAREQANRLNRQYVNNVVRKNRERWADRYINSWDYEKIYPIKVSSVKGEKEGERRVFCKICLDGFEEKLIAAIDARLKAQDESRSRRAKTALEHCERGETEE